MKAVAACKSLSSKHRAGPCARAMVAAVTCLAACGAWALDEDAATSLALQSAATSPGGLARPQLEISTSSLPRFDADGSTRDSRIDMTWMASTPSALGLSLGMSNPDGRGFAPGGQRNDGPSLDLGLRWRQTLVGNYRVDVVAWRRMAPPDALTLVQSRQPTYGARVELPLSPVSKTGLVADRGFLGFQLEGGARLALRRSHGGPMLYYRSKF